MDANQINQNNISLPTQQNINTTINTNINNLKKNKHVTFQDTITIYSVESYKELTKKMCYNEEEGLAQYYRNAPYGSGRNSHPFYDYKSYYNNVLKPRQNRPKKHSDSECTCKIL